MSKKGSRPRKRKKSNAGLIIIILLQLILIGGVYAYGLNYSSQKFFPGTTIEGLDVGKMTAEEAEAKKPAKKTAAKKKTAEE